MSKLPRLSPAEFDGERARQLAVNIRSALGGVSARSTADAAGLDARTLRNILSGAKWPDLRTITLLEEALDVALWPARDAR